MTLDRHCSPPEPTTSGKGVWPGGIFSQRITGPGPSVTATARCLRAVAVFLLLSAAWVGYDGKLKASRKEAMLRQLSLALTISLFSVPAVSAQLMDSKTQARLAAAAPTLASEAANDALHGRDGGKRLDNVLPYLVSDGAPDCFSADAKFISHLLVTGPGRAPSASISYKIFGQLGVPVSFAESVASFRNHVIHVVKMRPEKQVVRIDAGAGVASVQHMQPIRRSPENLEGSDVRAEDWLSSPAALNLAVSMTPLAGSPEDAAVCFFAADILEKAINERYWLVWIFGSCKTIRHSGPPSKVQV